MLFDGPVLRYLDKTTTREKYEQLRNIYWAYRYDIDNSSICVTPFNKKLCIVNKDLRKWLNWVNKNIILNLGLDTELTTRIKLRIALNMLDKVNITKLEILQISINLKDNLNEEIYTMNIDELPF